MILAVQDGAGGVGQFISLEITVANALEGVSGFQLTVTVENASVAQIVSVAFPDYGEVNLGPSLGLVSLTEVSPLPASSVTIAATDLSDVITGKPEPQVLATLNVELLSPGPTQLTISESPQLDDDSGDPIAPVLVPGSLTVE